MNKTKNFALRITDEMFEYLSERAEKNNRSINAEINTIIENVRLAGIIKGGQVEWFNTPEGIEQSR